MSEELEERRRRSRMAEVAGLHCSVSEADGGEGEVAGLRRMGGVLLECWISACCAKRRDIGRTRI